MIPGQITYSSLKDYLGTATTLQTRLTKVEGIITALEDEVLTKISDGLVEEYELDDGQVKIKTRYSSVEQITRDIQYFEKLKYRIINQLTGRVTRNRNYKNFPNGLWR